MKRAGHTCALAMALAVTLPLVAHADPDPDPDSDGDESGPELDLPPGADPLPGRGANPITIGGYGELHFNRVIPESGEKTSEIDFHRMVVYLGRQFGSKIRFYSELEVEHAIVGDGKPGEVAIEQAFIEYELADEWSPVGKFGVRAGIVLVPMGIINQWHEPPIFHGVERPNVDKLIIPSTWREGGAGIYGRPLPELRYELYVLGGLDPTGFSAKSGIRGGRQKVGEARADGLAFSGRVEYQLDTSTVFGVAGYFGQSGKNSVAVQAADLNVPVLGVALDARTRKAGFEARAVFATFTVGDAEELNGLMDADGNSLSDVGDSTLGGYAEVAYDVLHTQPTPHQLLPFARYEYYQTHPDDDTRKVTDISLGLTYRPVPQVAFKSDVILRRPKAGDSATILDLGIGFLY